DGQLARAADEREQVLLEGASHGAFAHLAAGLLGRLGYVDIASDAPLRTIGHLAGPLGALLDGLPVADEHRVRHEIDAHRDPTPLAGQAERFRAFADAGHGDRRVRALERLHVELDARVRISLRDAESEALALV